MESIELVVRVEQRPSTLSLQKKNDMATLLETTSTTFSLLYHFLGKRRLAQFRTQVIFLHYSFPFFLYV